MYLNDDITYSNGILLSNRQHTISLLFLKLVKFQFKISVNLDINYISMLPVGKKLSSIIPLLHDILSVTVIV